MVCGIANAHEKSIACQYIMLSILFMWWYTSVLFAVYFPYNCLFIDVHLVTPCILLAWWWTRPLTFLPSSELVDGRFTSLSSPCNSSTRCNGIGNMFILQHIVLSESYQHHIVGFLECWKQIMYNFTTISFYDKLQNQ
jgi:hypothetical protein